jgi:hypothetical protein
VRATCPGLFVLLVLITSLLYDEYKLCTFLHPPVTSILFGPNIPLSINNPYLWTEKEEKKI